MSNKITPNRNTFYKRKLLDKDLPVNAGFPDTYNGASPEADITTKKTRQFFIANSIIPELPEYVDDTEITESYLSFYPTEVSSSSAFTIPRLKLYKTSDDMDITEGKLNIEGDSDIAAFCSYIDYERSRMTDDFGGNNIGFGDRTAYSKEVRENVTDPTYMYYEIGGEQYEKFLDDSGYYDSVWMNEAPSEDSVIVLKRSSPVGVYYPHKVNGKESRDASWYKWGDEEEPWMNDEDKMIAMTVSDLEEYGATPQGGSYQWNPQTPKTFDIYDTQFSGRVTQMNSIFNYVKESPDAEDIKVQTVGTTGDDDKFYTYSRLAFNSTDKLTGGASAHFKNFWENYSGSSNRYAKYFGTNEKGAPYPQAVMACIDYFPQPVPLDFCGPSNYYAGSPFSGQSDSQDAAESQMDDCRLNGSASEIEMTMKLEKVPPVMYIDDPEGVTKPNMRFNRGFYIIFSEAIPNKEETFYQFMHRCSSSAAASTGIMFFKNRQVDQTGGEEIQAVPFLDAKNGGGIPMIFSGSSADNCDLWSASTGSSGTSPASYWESYRRMEVPENKYFTLRFKFTAIPNEVASGSRILAYCPDVFDSSGEMANMVLQPGEWPKESGSYLDFNSISLWALNFRSIADNSDSTSSNAAVNMLQEESGFTNDDQEQSILLDSFSFVNYNNVVNNASINNNNPVPTPLRLKYDTTVPAWSPQSGGQYDPLITPTNVTAVGVNYFGEKTVPVQNNLCFGFETLPDFTNNAKSIMLNGYGATGPTSLSPDWYFISGTYSNNQDGPISGSSQTRNGMKPAGYGSTISEDANGYFNVSGGAHSIDAFKQKGFFGISGAFANATKRENWLVSARVLRANKDGTEIVVDNPSIFDLPLGPASEGGTDYVMWMVDDPNTSDNRKLLKTQGYQSGESSIGYGSNDVLYQVSKRRGSTIRLNKRTDISTSGNNSMTATNPEVGAGTLRYQVGDGARKPRLGSIFISPKKYWFNLHVVPAKPTPSSLITVPYRINQRKWGRWFAPADLDSGYQYGNKDPFYPQILNTRSWSSAVLVSGTIQNTITDGDHGYIGSTYNEFKFTDGNTAQRKWNLSNRANSLLETNVDYGYGVYEDPTDDTPQKFGGYINEVFPISGAFNYIDLKSYTKIGNPEWGSKFNFSIYPFYEDNTIEGAYYNVKIDTREKDGSPNNRGTNPTMIWGARVPLIDISNYTVTPAVDVLKMENPLDESATNFSDVKFTWRENGKPWYRLLWADTVAVTNKYHQANLIIPLNENPDDRTYQNSPAQSYLYLYSSSSDFAKKTNGTTFKTWRNNNALATHIGSGSMDDSAQTDYRSLIDGFCGYGISGNAHFKIDDNNYTIGAADQFTFMCHAIPHTGDALAQANNYHIFNASSSAGSEVYNFGVHIRSSDKKVEAFINNSGATVVGTTSLEMNQVQPVMIAVTYNKNRDSNNLKLYVNGKLEDTADYTSDFNANNNHLYIGYMQTEQYEQSTMRIEEISFHKKEAFFPVNTNNFVLDTSGLPDLSGGATLGPSATTNVYQSRLFAMDYHNIRGVSPKEVARSDVASWNVVGL